MLARFDVFCDRVVLILMPLCAILILVGAAAFGTLLLAANGRAICVRLGLMDVPDVRKHHRHETPLLGGLALTCIMAPLAILASRLVIDPAWQVRVTLYVIATFALAFLGMADDRHSLTARDRIVLSMLVFGSTAFFDPAFNVHQLSFAAPRFDIGLGSLPVAMLFTSVCCVGLCNAVNMADGKNGLVIGLCTGWLAILAVRAPEPLLPLFAILGGILVVLLVFNMRGKLFLGDGGSYGFATAIGLLTIMLYNSPGAHLGRCITAGEIVLLFAVPVIDSFRLTISRIRRGQSPMSADRDHLHHHLLDRLGWPGGLLAYWAVALVPAFAIMVF